MNERWEAFDKIWAKGKNGKMRMRLMSKCVQRNLEPTEDNCRDYWMGYVRNYVDGWTGQGHHINPRKNKILIYYYPSHVFYTLRLSLHFY